MKKTVVLDIVGLTHELIGEYTPFLSKRSAQAKMAYVKPTLAAITCPTQSCYLTGKWPTDHRIVANGWYFHELCEIKNWQQSNKFSDSRKNLG